MTFFKKKETLLQNITYMAIMAAINVIFVFLTFLQPFLLFLLVLFLPLTSCVTTILCKKRYYPIYAVVTLSICLVISFTDGLFFVLPSLISGFLFGLFIDTKLPMSLLVITTAYINTFFTFASIPLIQIITEVDILQTFQTLFGLEELVYFNYVSSSFIFVLSLAQQTFAFIICKNELPKMGIQIQDTSNNEINTIGIISFIPIIILLSCIEIVRPFVYIAVFSMVYFTINCVVPLLLSNKKLNYILLSCALLISFGLFAIFYTKIIPPLGFLPLFSFSPLVAIIIFTNNYCLKKKSNSKI